MFSTKKGGKTLASRSRTAPGMGGMEKPVAACLVRGRHCHAAAVRDDQQPFAHAGIVHDGNGLGHVDQVIEPQGLDRSCLADGRLVESVASGKGGGVRAHCRRAGLELSRLPDYERLSGRHFLRGLRGICGRRPRIPRTSPRRPVSGSSAR